MDLENDIRALLAAHADAAGPPPPIDAGRIRAARTRRTLTGTFATGTTAALVVAVALAVVALVGDVPSRADRGATHPSTGGTENMEGEVVAHGTVGGATWALTAYTDRRSGLLCTEYEISGLGPAGGGAGCWDTTRTDIGVSFGGPPRNHRHQQAIYGWVPSGATHVELRSDSGRTEKLRVLSPPAGVASSTRFFVKVFAPLHVNRVQALSRGGSVLSSAAVGHVDQLQLIGHPVVVATGSRNGVLWRFSEQASNLGPCASYSFGRHGSGGGGKGCSIGVPVKHLVGFSESGSASLPKAVPIYGAVGLRVANVSVRLNTGAEIRLKVVKAPSRFALPLRFFYGFIPRLGGATPDEIVARDVKGQVVERHPLCSGLGMGTCGN